MSIRTRRALLLSMPRGIGVPVLIGTHHEQGDNTLTLTVTVGVGGVPIGADIFAVRGTNNTSAALDITTNFPTVADTKTHTYTREVDNLGTGLSTSTIAVSLFRAKCIEGLASGNTITSQGLNVNGNNRQFLTAFYVKGLAAPPIDATAVIGTDYTQGPTSTPNYTNLAEPALLIGVSQVNFDNESTPEHADFTTIDSFFNLTGTNTRQISARVAYKFNSIAAAQAYGVAFDAEGANRRWATILAGYKA